MATPESRAERNNRNLSDLLQELRVAGLGVQMLFGFLLALPFTVRFTMLDPAQRGLYRASLLCAALATALLISPVAYHRWVFRKHEKGQLLKTANVVAILGLIFVALAVCSAVWLILSFVGDSWPISVFAVLVMFSFFFLWFVLPIFERLTTHPDAFDGS
jgi:O-antigen/teichoic acid export membrane protein